MEALFDEANSQTNPSPLAKDRRERAKKVLKAIQAAAYAKPTPYTYSFLS